MLVLVFLNLFLTLASPRQASIPRAVRVAQAQQGAPAAAAAAAGAPKSWWDWGGGRGSGKGGDGKGGAGKGGAAKPRAVKPPSRSPAPKPKKEDFVTHEHCYAQSDESEACFYHGAVCYDGDHLVVMAEDGHGQDARTSMCYDFRHFVASPSCGYNGPHKRHNLAPDVELPFMRDEAPRLLSYRSDRKWGPQGRETHYREVDPSMLAEVDAAGYNEEYNVTLQWLDGPMYVGGLHHSWLDHTWHFAAAAMMLWDIKRYNRSHHVDYASHVAGRLQTVGAYAAPPMDYLLVAGDYRNVKGPADLRPWIANLLSLLVQNHTNILWNSVWKQGWGVGPNRWLCAKEAVVIGLKPRMFNSACSPSPRPPAPPHAQHTQTPAAPTASPPPSPPQQHPPTHPLCRHRRRPRVAHGGVPVRGRGRPHKGRVAAPAHHHHHAYRLA
jgi:hypothetical protein